MSLQQQLHTLESSGLIKLAQSVPELEYLFRHAMVQEAVYASLLKHDRIHWHQAVGEAMEQMYPDRTESLAYAPLLAQHFDAAGDHARALKYYSQAGDLALQQYANAEAAMHYARAIDLAQQTHVANLQQLYLRRGRALELSARDREALKNYEAMRSHALSTGDQTMELAALIALATVYAKPVDVRDAEKSRVLLDQALMLAHTLNSREAEAKVFWNLMLLNKFDGNPVDGLRYGEQALTIARELDLREQLAYILNDIHGMYLFAGDVHKAHATLSEAQGLWRQLGISNMLADSLGGLAGLYVVQAQYEQALAASQEATRISRAIGNVWNQSYSLLTIDLALFDRGEIGRAIETAQECARLGEQAGFAPGLVQSLAGLAYIYAYVGAIDRGEAALDDLSEWLSHQGTLGYADSMVSIARANLLLRKGQKQAAIELFERTQRVLQEQAAALADYVSAYVGLLGAELMLIHGDYAALIEELDAALIEFKAHGIRIFKQDALHYKAMALLGQNRIDEAYDMFQQARIEAEEIGARRVVWQTLYELSCIEAQRGHVEAATRLLRQSRELIQYIARHTGSAELSESFLNLSHVKTVLDSIDQQETT